MRVWLSLDDGSPDDVVITADPETPVGEALALVSPGLRSTPMHLGGKAGSSQRTDRSQRIA